MSFIQFSKRKLRKRKKIIYKSIFLFLIFVFILVAGSLSLGKRIDEEIEYFPRVSEVLPYDFDGDIYFNNTDGFDKYYKATIDALESAEESIQIAIYSISDEKMVSILNKKKLDGVIVNIVVPKSKMAQHKYVFANTILKPVEVGSLSDVEDFSELMHHKFILIDSGGTNQQLLFGSSNLTYLQQKYDSSFLVVTSEDSLIKIFQDEFNLLKENKYGLKKISTGEFKPYAFEGFYNNGFINIWFGPGYKKNSIKNRMIMEIDNAKSSIMVIGWRINDLDIYKALEKKAEEGVSVKIIMDDYYMWDELSIANNFNGKAQVFSDSFMHVILDRRKDELKSELGDIFNSFVHHHTLIVDEKILFTGTNNWSQGGFHYNDESIIITDIKKFVNGYIHQFNYLYDTLHGQEVDTLVDSKNIFNIRSVIDGEWSKVIFYTEKNDSSWLGEVCFEMSYEEYKEEVLVPNECNSNRSRIFIIGPSGNLMASDYLNYN